MLMKLIRDEIQNCGKSRYVISKETGIDKAALCRIMQGGSCKAETLEALFTYFGLKVLGKGIDTDSDIHFMKKGPAVKRHKYRSGEPTATFEDLDFAEQTKSISATIMSLGRMIDSNVKRANKEGRDARQTMEKRLKQVQRMIDKRQEKMDR